MATAVEVLSAYEVETFLLYCAEDVEHRIAGVGAFQGEGTGAASLRQTMIRTLRRYVNGFRGKAVGVHAGPGFAAVEWEGAGVDESGASGAFAGSFLVEHVGAQVTRVVGYVVPRGPPPSPEEGEGEDVDEDGDDDRDG